MSGNEKLENEKDEVLIKYIVVEEDPSSPEKNRLWLSIRSSNKKLKMAIEGLLKIFGGFVEYMDAEWVQDSVGRYRFLEMRKGQLDQALRFLNVKTEEVKDVKQFLVQECDVLYWYE
jgi:hypothetical protein